jgi:hypothetical protein
LPVVTGTRLRVQHAEANVNPADVNAMFDDDLRTRWHAGQQRGHESVTIDLGMPHRVAWVVPCLGTYASQYPRSLVVETSLDGASWTTAWSGRTALAAYEAAVAEPRVIPLPLRIQGDARLIRLRQIANEPARPWTIVELRIFE